jgi:hypothetical protein
MAQRFRDRVRAGLGSMTEWLAERDDDIMQAKADIEENARRFYGTAAGASEQTVARAVAEAKERASGGRKAAMPGPRMAPRPDEKRHGSKDQQFLDNAKRILADTQRNVHAAAQRAGDSQLVRKVAGDASLRAGNVSGLVTGTLQAAEDLKDGAIFFGRLLDVTEPYRRPIGEAAWDNVASAAGAAVDYGKRAFADPRGAAHEIMEGARRAQRETDPRATAPAATLSAEIQRNFNVGQRQGEVVAEGASWLVGTGELKAAAGVGRMSRATLVTKHLDEGFSPGKAAHLADLYTGRGDHAFLKERTRLPEFMGGGPLPRWALDNPFNVLKPNGISRGEMYELHSRVDPFFYGAGFPRRVGGGGWSSKRLGIEKYPLPQRIYHRTPGPTKAVVGGAAVIGGGYLNERLEAPE